MSRRAIAAAVGAAVLAAPCLLATAGQAAPGLGAEDRKLLIFYAEADNLASFGQAKAWPGYRFERYPLVVFEPDRVAFQFNSRKPLPGFTPLANPPARARFPVFVRYGSTRSLVPSFALPDYVRTIGGQKVIPIAASGIRNALPGGYSPASHHYFPLLVHLKESYGWYSEYMARGEDWIARYPLADSDNFALADLEAACLKRAVTVSGLNDAYRATRWFIAVHQARQAKLSPTSWRHENYQEALVGTARYGSMHLAIQGSTPGYRPLDAFRALGRPAHPTSAGLVSWLAAAFDIPMDVQALTRDRLPLTGIAQGMLLDRFHARDWRRDLPGTSSLAALLSRVINYSDGDRNSLVEEAKKALNFEVMLARAQGLASHTRSMAEAFERQDGWTIKVRLPHIRDIRKTAGPLGLRWEPPGHRPLEVDSRSMLFISLKALYFNSPTIDIRLSGVPTKFYSTEYAYPYRNLIVRLPLDQGAVKLDGRTLEMLPGRYPIARSLTIRAAKANLKFTQGTLRVSRDTLDIEP